MKENCPNLMKAYPESEWGDALYQGKMYSFPSLLVDGADPQYKDDLYVNPMANWAGFWTTESILKQCGYSFTPYKDIIKKVNVDKKKPAREDFELTPKIATTDDFYNFLKKIKETVKSPDGKEIIPFSMTAVMQPHFGAMFGITGPWQYDPLTKRSVASWETPRRRTISSISTSYIRKVWWTRISPSRNGSSIRKSCSREELQSALTPLILRQCSKR